MADARDALTIRLREVGLDEAVDTDPRATIVPPREAASAPAPASPRVVATAAVLPQELPHISVALPSTAPPSTDAPPASSPARDLEVRRKLGEGGMGRVFLARQRSLDRDVALKTVRDRATASDHAALIAEGSIMGHLEHPSIVPVHALGTDDEGRPVLVMKHVEGVAWSELLADPGHAAWHDTGDGTLGAPTSAGEPRGEPERLDRHLAILMQVCHATHFAHARGVVHRDIKPANVLIGRFGDVYLADWGIAVRMGTGPSHRICGTPGFMAPEMAFGDVVDARTDVYLLGATLHQLLTGRMRHDARDVASVIADAIASEPYDYPMSVPAGLAAIANRATAREPEGRFESALAFRRAIEDHLRHRSSLALSASAADRVARLRELVASPPAEDPAELEREADRLVAEIRFALGQATEQWAENPEAGRSLAALEEVLAVRRARAAALASLARELDPATNARQRTIALVAACVGAGGVLVVNVVNGARYTPSPVELFWLSLPPLAIMGGATAALWRHLSQSALNRAGALTLVGAASLVTIARALGLLAGEATSTMLLRDALIVTSAAVFSAIVWLRGYMVAAGFLLIGCVVMARAPEYGQLTFSLASAAAFSTAVVVGMRAGRRPGAPRA